MKRSGLIGASMSVPLVFNLLYIFLPVQLPVPS